MFARSIVLGLLLAPSVAFAQDVEGDDAEEVPVEPVSENPADEVSAHHALYAELGGAGLLYSINYDLRVLRHFSVRVGFEGWPLCFSGQCALLTLFPLSLFGLAGGTNHHFEYGVGVTLSAIDDDDAQFWVPSLGYRYQRPGGGFFSRVTLVGMFRMNDVDDWLALPGVSFGRSF